MRSSDDFEITLPVEHRQEDRVTLGHSYSEWKWRLQEFHHRCAYCGIHQRATPERHLCREHVIPVSREGTDIIANVVPACYACNHRKGPCCPGELTKDGWIVPVPRIYQRRSRRSS
jgi:5-methylcytosine-specific restriction endonuclease McrA